MAAGISDRLWDMEDVVALIDAAAEAPKPRGPYKPGSRRPLNGMASLAPVTHAILGAAGEHYVCANSSGAA